MVAPVEVHKMVDSDRAKHLYQQMRKSYDELIDFIVDTPMKDIIEEMYTMPEDERPDFVSEKILNPEYLAGAGVSIPDDILIQRSSFGDGRPTLFVVKKYLDEDDRDIWENVNITFDQEADDGEQKAPEVSWQKPLPPTVLSACQALGISGQQLQQLREG